MHPSQMEDIVRRLVANPHDEAALGTAHAAGQQDPRGYAMLLERVGEMSSDATYAAHWLAEAANVWAMTIGDAPRAARLLMRALDRDPASDVAADRLAGLYREKGDVRALVALYERRAKALAPIAQNDPTLRQRLSLLHEDLGRLWQDAPLSQPRKAVENYKKAFEIDPSAVAAIYAARELLKAEGNLKEALPLYAAEIRAIDDVERKLALHRDEAAVRQQANDGKGASQTLREARRIAPDDMGLVYELATSIVTRILGGEKVGDEERQEAADLLVGMAEQYDGEHALAYSTAALDAQPGHDRAMQLAAHFAASLGKDGEVVERWAAYVQASPDGALAIDGRKLLAKTYEDQKKLEEAIKILEPLKDENDQEVIERLTDLYSKAGKTKELAAHMERHAASLPVGERINKVVAIAAMLASKGQKRDALAKYNEVLALDPQHPEALAFVEEQLRSTRQYKDLREVLLAAARVASAETETRKSRLREVANLSEQQLRDPEGAIGAYRQLLAIDRADDAARAALHRLLEKTQHWDDLAALIEQEAMAAADTEEQIALERKLAELHQGKRNDKKEAANALLRIVRVAPKDDQALTRAVQLLVEAGENERAAQAIDEAIGEIDAGPAKGQLFVKLGELREGANDFAKAADAYHQAADLQQDAAIWKRAEEASVRAEKWEQASVAAGRRGDLEKDPAAQSKLRASEAEYLVKAGDPITATVRLEQAVELAPTDEDLATRLEQLYEQEGRLEDLAAFLVRRADDARDDLKDEAKSVALLRRAALFRKDRLNDPDGARDLLRRVIESREDAEALAMLADDAATRGEHKEAVELLARMEKLATTKDEKKKVALRQAGILADGVGDVDAALARYRSILDSIDADCREALQAIADLEEAREHYPAAADALERDLELAAAGEEKANIARRLAEIYVDHTHELGKSLAAYETVMREDSEDFASLQKLRELSERAEKWPRVLELLDRQIEVEGDDEEIANLTARKAEVLADHLDKVEEGLRVLAPLTAAASDVARATALAIADRHGAHAQIGGQILAWARTTGGAEGQRFLGEAFDRFVRGKALDRALEIAPDLLRTPRGKEAKFLEDLEPLAVEAKATELALEVHDRRAAITSGPARAEELVRQAKVRIKLGVSVDEAVGHGEIGLGAAAPGDAARLLEELAMVFLEATPPQPIAAVELYERNVSRSKVPADRLAAMVRAYRFALSLMQKYADARASIAEKAKELVESALGVSGVEDPFESLYAAAREADDAAFASGDGGATESRRALIATLVASSVGPRDGGRTRSAHLRRAAQYTKEDLGDEAHAFQLLGQALVAHVDAATLDAVEAAAGSDAQRAEAVLTKALEEVFDGPLVRQILARRAAIRQDKLGDVDGALKDLKRLHELAPADQAITDRYRGLLTDSNDYRGLVQLLEDQILRSKDQSVRADLARQIARLWEERLGDARETADAWRRVLRLKPQDPEATQGLDRAKRNKLNFDPEKYPPQRVAAPASIAPPPPKPPSTPPETPPPSTAASSVDPVNTEREPMPPKAAASSGELDPPSFGEATVTSAARVTSKPPPPPIRRPPSSPPAIRDAQDMSATTQQPAYDSIGMGAAPLIADDDEENMATLAGDSAPATEHDMDALTHAPTNGVHAEPTGGSKTDEIAIVNLNEAPSGELVSDETDLVDDDEVEEIADDEVEEVPKK